MKLNDLLKDLFSPEQKQYNIFEGFVPDEFLIPPEKAKEDFVVEDAPEIKEKFRKIK
jgi:hypothetical protein